MKIANIALTHTGKFHADDVFSSALLRIANPKIRIVRVSEVPKGFEGIVFDIGRGEYDHHQENAEVRPNGVPYASFGLLWRQLGRSLLEQSCPPDDAKAFAEAFDEHFIQPLDADDNTGCGNQLAGAIGAFNPSWDSERPADECFDEAAAVAEKILRRQFERMFAEERAKSLVEAALAAQQDGVVILPCYAPWKTALVPSAARFVVYPSKRGGFSAQVVPKKLGEEEAKCPFPVSWAGKEGGELEKLSGIKTLRFCHKGRFMAVAGTKEDAVLACRIAEKIARQSVK